ncbi:MAG: chemotaxis protein CheW, partial [Deltaproteobacteria bacterium]
MKELVLIEIEGNRYGIWKDALHSACFDVLRVHGFPVGNSFVSGVADHEGKMCTFYDLSASLGHGAYDRNLPGRGVLLTEGRRPSGLVFRREVGRVQAARQKVLDLPDFMATSEISTCIMVEGEPALILDIQAMAERVSEGLYAP